MLTDRYGNEVSTRNAKALAAYDLAVEQFNTYQIDPIATIHESLAADPGFVMGHLFKAGLLVTTGERGFEGMLREAVEAAEAHAAIATPRERLYMAACRAWLQRDFSLGVKCFGDIVSEYPRDLVALQIAHLGDFLLGQAPMLRDRPTQVLPAWSTHEHGYSYVLGMQAFGLEECGAYTPAEHAGRRALELAPADGWAAHAVAHVMEMQGRTEDGIQWLQETSAGWSPGSFFAFHNWWHLALYRLELGDYGAVLDLYDTRIRNPSATVVLELIDATAMLWRLHLRNANVGDRWQSVADAWEPLAEDGYLAFNDVHALLAFAATGRTAAVQRVLGSLERVARLPDTNGRMTRDVGLPVARAIVAFAQGDYARTIDELQQVRGFAQRFGGSNAQRDLLQLTLLEAALRSGRRRLAEGLVAERLASKPTSPANRLFLQRADKLPLPATSRAA